VRLHVMVRRLTMHLITHDKIMKNIKINFLLFCSIAIAICQPDVHGSGIPSINEIRSNMKIAESPMRVCVGDKGYFVTDPANNTLIAYDFFGQVINKKTDLKSPLGIAVGKSNNIFVAETGSKSVSIYDSGFNLIGYLGSGDNEFLLPNHIVVGESNGIETVFVSDSLANEIKIYQQNKLVKRLGVQGGNPGQFLFPAGLAINNQNELLVVDQGNDRVQVFTLDGIFKRSFSLAKPGTFGVSGRAQGIATDQNGRIYVADMLQCLIKIFDANGTYLYSYGKNGFGSGKLYNPSDIAIDKFSRAYIASPNSSKIEIIGIDCFLDMQSSIVSQYVPEGTNVYFSVSAGCDFTSYQWMKNDFPLMDSERISGSKTSTLTINTTTLDDSGTYYLVLSNQSSSVTSAPINLVVLSVPVIIKSPEDKTAAAGSDVIFEVVAKGGDLRYQWFFNNNPFAGATSPELVLRNVSTESAGDYYVVVTNILGAATSGVAKLTIVVAPSLSFSRSTDGGLIFSWDTSKYILQYATNLSGEWLDVTTNQSPLVITVSEMRSDGSRFFRLRKLP